jgi:ABC-2 type transport system permease protein/lipopolysaccharide transport system permease protein
MSDTVLELPRNSKTPRTRKAVADVLSASGYWPLWSRLAWQDVRQQYRGSVLGPLWLTISMSVMVATLGVLYSQLFKVEIQEYLPFLAIGIIVWGLILGLVSDATKAFVANAEIMKQVPLPIMTHVFRLVWRNFIIFFHNIVIYVGVAIWFSISPGLALFWVVPGLLIICGTALAVGLILGMLSARYRDVPQMVMSVMQIAFFLSPIMWSPTLMPERALIIDYNPIHHFIELVRRPLLTGMPEGWTFVMTLGTMTMLWAIAFFLLVAFRNRITYWL